MNNITKRPIRQRKPNRQELIEAAQAELLREKEQFVNEKAALGYGGFSNGEFLDVVPDETMDTDYQSKLIVLQEQCRELKAREDILWAEERVVDVLNTKHAVVHADQTYILTEKKNTLGWSDFSLESRQSFRAYYEDETIVCIDGIERCIADIWLRCPRRRKYKGIIFDPTIIELHDGYYNLWKGFAKEARQGCCQKYWIHVRDNICNGNEEHYHYLRKWLAFIFQHPNIVHTALVLCGSQGVGKNSFVEPLGALLGAHYAPLSSIAELVSNFNFHLKNAVLIHANEALWGGNKKEIGTVKAMITDRHCLIEGKGKDRIIVCNFKHVILSSNEDWPVHLDPDDRRFLVLKVSEKHKEDHAYFKAIQDELNNGGYEALLYDLLHEDVAAYDPRRLPTNSDSFYIKIRSADSSHRYLYEALCEGGFSIGHNTDDGNPVWQGPIPKDDVYQDYTAWCQKSGEEIQSKELFCRVLRKCIPSVEDIRPGGQSRVRCYRFPSIWEAREEFSKSFKEKAGRIFDDHDCFLGMSTM